MAKTKHYVDEAMDQMMDSLAEQAETERERQIAIEAGICMYCGTSAKDLNVKIVISILS